MEKHGCVEYLKESKLPLVLYGTAHLADCVKFVLDWHSIKIDFVAVDKEYYNPNTNYRGFYVQPIEDILANNEKVNVIMAFIDKTVETRHALSQINNLPNVEKCLFFEPANLTSYLRVGEWAEMGDADFLKLFIDKVKQSDIIYLNSEEEARAIADNWNGEIKQPELRFVEDAIPVVLCANGSYAPYLAVMLQSLLDFSNPERIYHFIIFERGFSEKTKQCLVEQVARFEWCEIDFVDVSGVFDGLLLNTVSHFSVDAYSRLLIPYLIDKYKKVIYVDSDMVAKADIAELYDLNIQPFCLGATICQWFEANLEKKSYSCFLTASPVPMFLENWNNIFSSGTLVFDTQKFREKISYNDLFRSAIYLSNRYSKHLLDQDVLNLLVKDDFFVLPPQWNYLWEQWSKNETQYSPAKPDTKILHFSSRVKPWKSNPKINNNPETLAYLEYARKIELFRNSEKGESK